MKILGNKIRAYQGGEPIGQEFNVYYSESLQFVAIEAFHNDTSSSKMIEVKFDDNVLYSETFEHCKIIHSAKMNELATSLFIFHNGNSNRAGGGFNDVMSFIQMERSKELSNRFNRLERAIEDKKKRSIKDRLIKDEYGLYVNATNYETCRNDLILAYKRADNINSDKIPMWIRRIFKAV